MKIAEFANSVDLDEVAHLDLHCLLSGHLFGKKLFIYACIL